MNNSTSVSNNELPDKLLPFIWRYLRNKKWCLFGITFVAITHSIEISLNPYLLKVIINTVIQYSSDTSKLIAAITLPAAIYIALPMIINVVLRFFQYINLHLYPYIKASVGKDVFTYLLNHSSNFFQNTYTGSLTKKIGDLVEIDTLISMMGEFYFRFVALLFACFTLFLTVKPLFGFILLLWSICFIYYSYIANKKSELYARQYSEDAAKVGGSIADSVANVMSTKLFGNIENEVTKVKNDIDAVVNSDRALAWYNLKMSFVQGTGVTLLIAFMLIGLIYGRLHDWVSAGDFALVLMLSMSMLQIVYSIGRDMQKFAKIVGTCNQALTFVRAPHEITDKPNAVPIKITQGEIQFKNVNFQYEKSDPLFMDLNVTIKPGEKVGLVGYSGGGKSSFIKLILRLIDTQSGTVTIDSQDIKHVTKQSLRKQIGTIPQESDLFHRTIMENIRFARMDASDEEVIAAAKKARCHEFIVELPDQYQSLVGEKGVKLSGGQRQRIAIARAFLKNAPILILDEATSSLDSITERYIQESLHDIIRNRTTIVIAHRLSTLKDMDRILVFVKGKIIEDGSLESLLANKDSHFYKLWQMQAGGFIPPVVG
jgi:ATP-binding cassette subfamily B protein